MNAFERTIRPAYAVSEAQSALVRSVFGWMTAGLVVTGLTASYVLSSPGILETLFRNSSLLWILLFAELGLVVWLSARAMRMSSGQATAMFLLYSALNGITLTPIAFVYTHQSIANAFLISGGLFGSMALWGYATKRDLTSMGSFMMMGMFGIFLAAIVNIFLGSGALSFAIGVTGVVVFTGLAAYDVQKIKNLGTHLSEDHADFRRASILGALTLYLDFINLFLSLLRLLGNSRD